MDKNYLKLFQEIARSSEVIAEQVMEVNKNRNDNKALLTSQNMRDDFAALTDKLKAEDFSENNLTLKDIALLNVGATILTEQLERQVTEMEKSLTNYKTNILPKFKECAIEIQTHPDENIENIINEKFHD